MKRDAEGSKDLSAVSAQNWTVGTQEGRGLTDVLSTGQMSHDIKFCPTKRIAAWEPSSLESFNKIFISWSYMDGRMLGNWGRCRW